MVNSMHTNPPQMRSDLKSVQVPGRRRAFRIVIDEIGGRFARIPEHLWQQLGSQQADAHLWTEAKYAGWLRDRSLQSGKRFSLLAIKIPLGSLDSIANYLVGISRFVFSPTAILMWFAVVALVSFAVISRLSDLSTSIGMLGQYVQQASPLFLAVVFVGTKFLHELGHAVMCRRIGARSGDFGVLLLCGFPCPYCDVSDIWRESSAGKRAAVMLAGIYIELIIASIAGLIWLLSIDPWVRMSALNVMLVCSVSTLVFNANPLMRYDGYYVLADLIGSVNLRQESSLAFHSVVTRRIAGAEYPLSPRSDRRALCLTAFHVCSCIYRLLVFGAISVLMINLADRYSMRSLAVLGVMLTAAMMVTREIMRLGRALFCIGRWKNVSLPRRFGSVGLFCLFLLIVLLIPLPRYRQVHGVVDAVNTTSVFLPHDGIVENVVADFGQSVRSGQTLLQLSDIGFQKQQIELQSALRLAKLRSEQTRQVALSEEDLTHDQSIDQWKTLSATEDAIEVQLQSVSDRIADCKVDAPINGTLIAATPYRSDPGFSLDEKQYGWALAKRAWCRVSADGKLQARLLLNAQDRDVVDEGTFVSIQLSPAEPVHRSHVISVSAIHQSENEASLQRASYQVLCPLPEVTDDQLVHHVGRECRGVIRLPSRSFADDFTSWLSEWIRG